MSDPATQAPASVTFAVQGMNCKSCVRHIDEAIREQFPAATPSIDLATKQVTVAYDPQTATTEAIAKVLDEAGYPAQAV